MIKERDNSKYSSFWAGDFTNIDKTDLIKLSSYQRAISRFVNIVTNRNDIKVQFANSEGSSYTDGKMVQLSADISDSNLDPAVGLALHEGSHIKLTNFNIMKQLVKQNTFPKCISNDYVMDISQKHKIPTEYARHYITEQLRILLNIVEDRRIDNYIYNEAPGYKGYYHAMYDKYFNNPIIDKALKSNQYREEVWDSYIFRITNIVNPNTDLTALNKLKEVYELINLKDIDRLKTTRQAFDLAGQLFILIEDNIPPLPQQEQNKDSENKDGDNNDESEGNGNCENNSGDSTEDDKPQQKKDSENEEGDANGDFSNGSDKDLEATLSKLSPTDIKKLEEAIQKQKDFQDGNIEKEEISNTTANDLKTVESSGVTQTKTGTSIRSGGIETVVVRNLTKRLIDSNLFFNLSNSYGVSNQHIVEKGIKLGNMLGRRLKTRNETKELVTPRMKNGKISNRHLHEVASGNFDIFNHTSIETTNPSIVTISIDASSSMKGSRWNNSQITAIAIAKAASMTSNLDVIITYRGIHQDTTVKPLVLVAYDSRVDKFSKIKNLFRYIKAYGSTPEGLCFEAILDDMMKLPKNSDRYFINFSDGEPGFDGNIFSYRGTDAIEHTAAQVKKIASYGITILSYFISTDSYSEDKFKQMYGKAAKTIDVTSIIPLSKTLNKMFEA